MKLICVKDFTHGHRVPAMDRPADGRRISEGVEPTEYKAGETYEIDDALAVRLIRDFGPVVNGRENPDQRFEPVNVAEANRAVRRAKAAPFEKYENKAVADVDV